MRKSIMSDTLKEFQQKIKNRKFAIDNSWKGNLEDEESLLSSNSCKDNPEAQLWGHLEENLMAADACKYFDGYAPIQSNRKVIGRWIVFIKKVVRRLIKIFMGWYIFPQYQRLSYFNGKMINVVSLEREILSSLAQQNQQILQQLDDRDSDELRKQIELLSLENKKLHIIVDQLNQKIKKMENLPTDDDEFYHDFEEKFRGSQDVIRERLRVYVPIIQSYLKDWPKAYCIDVGSGRGEWLDILKENGVENYIGIDLNEKQNLLCEGRGHKVLKKDCIEYLSSLSENSVDLITGFQLIEHLCLSDLLELLRQSYRVLKTGGLILFETPNPRNLIVGANTFYIDPSHKRPVNYEMVSSLAEWCKFKQVQCIDANAHANWTGITLESSSEEMKEVIQKFNDISYLLYGPRDYAILAVKE